MEEPQRPLSPKSIRTPSKLTQTFSRFKGIIRIPGHTRKPGANPIGHVRHGTTTGMTDDKGADNHPYSRRSRVEMKAYMSQPMLGQLRTATGSSTADLNNPIQTGYSEQGYSSSSASPSDRDSQYELPLPRPSIHGEIPSEKKRNSRSLSMVSLARPADRGTDSDTGIQKEPKPSLYSRHKSSDERPPLPKSPTTSLFKRKRSRTTATMPQSESAQPTPPENLTPTVLSGSSSQSSTSGIKSFTRALVRRASKSRLIDTSRHHREEEPPVPPLPSPYRKDHNPPTAAAEQLPRLEPSGSATTTPDSRSRKNSVKRQKSKGKEEAVPVGDDAPASLSVLAPNTTSKPKLKPSVSSFVSSSGSSFMTAASTLSSQHNEATTAPPATSSIVQSWRTANGEPSAVISTPDIQTSNSEGKKPLRIAMPVRRISLISTPEGNARLSPSIVHRPPPLPLLNLPKLPTPVVGSSSFNWGLGLRGEEGAPGTPTSRRRSLRITAGLSAMPALPLQGAARGVGGHEEVDDQEDDEDDEVDEGDEEDDLDEDSEMADDSSHHEETEVRSIGSGSGSGGSTMDGRSSYDHASYSASSAGGGFTGTQVGNSFGASLSIKPELPPLGVTSPFDIRFTDLGTPTAVTSGLTYTSTVNTNSSAKGKNKAVPTLLTTTSSQSFDPTSISANSYASIAGSDAGRTISLTSSSGSLFSAARGFDKTHGSGSQSSPVLSGSESISSSLFASPGHGQGRDNRLSLRLANSASPPSPSSAWGRTQSYGPGGLKRTSIFLPPSGPPSPGLQTPRQEYFHHSRFSTAAQLNRLSLHVPPLPGSSISFPANSIHNPNPNLNRNSVIDRHSVLPGSMGGTLSVALSNSNDTFTNGNGAGGGANYVKRPSMYKHASRSLIDIHSIEKREEVGRMVREGEIVQEAKEKEMIKRNRESLLVTGNFNANKLDTAGPSSSTMDGSQAGPGRPLPDLEGGHSGSETRGSASATNPLLFNEKRTSCFRDAAGDVFVDRGCEKHVVGNGGAEQDCRQRLNVPSSDHHTTSSQSSKVQNRMSSAPAYEAAAPHPLRKRRSMPMFNEATTEPPPYPDFVQQQTHPAAFGSMNARFEKVKILPREDEGKEELPPYRNDVLLKAILPRKMEFSSPGIQAKDRKWRRVLCVLEGTMLRIYKCPTGAGGVSVIEQWWESKVGVGDVAAVDGGVVGVTQPKSNDLNVEDEKLKHQYLGSPRGEDGQSSSSVQDGPEYLGHQRAISTPAPSLGLSPAQRPSTASKETPPNASQIAITKSALNLAVQFLKPSSRLGKHARSQSDVTPPSPTAFGYLPGATRSSVHLGSIHPPRSGSATPSSSNANTLSSIASSSRSRSRSNSPMPSSSGFTTASSYSESTLSRPSTAGLPSSGSSRPVTPSSAVGSSRSRARAGTTPAPSSATSSTFSTKGRSTSRIPEPNPEDLIKVYSLQNAESGLGNDYLKRKNVIRVRLEGEQFLLQAKDVPSVVEWIEGLQAATNIALDLDVRPMPRGPIFPRRRRRRRPQIPPITTSTPATGEGSTTGPPLHQAIIMVTETYTPTSATAGQPALRLNS